MSRSHGLALLAAAGAISLTFALAVAGPTSSGVSAGVCACVDCACPECNGLFCSCDVCACGRCGCAAASRPETRTAGCALRCTTAQARASAAVCGCEVCKCPDCNGLLCTCTVCECVGCACAR